MKKKIVVYGMFVAIYTVLSVVLTSSAMKGVEIIVRFFINLLLNSVVLITANAILSYNKNATGKTSFVHALFLAVIACVIALTVNVFTGESNGGNGSAIVRESTENISEKTEVGGVQMEVVFSDQDTSSRVMQIVLDILVAFIGGILGAKLFKRRNADPNNMVIV